MVDSLSTDKSLEVKKRIDDNCPNYDIIANFVVPKKDYISIELRNKYTDFITENILRENEINNVRRLDEIFGEYVKKGKFYKLIQKTYAKPVKDDDGNEYVFDLFDLMDYLYSSFTEKTIVSPRKCTRWL